MSIITLTVNPALDKSTTVERVVPDQKLRCANPQYDAGGGGINVSRVLRRLGANPMTIFQSSGPAGKIIEQLLSKEEVSFSTYPTAEWTRENLVVVDQSTNQQYRFGMPGPTYNEKECEQVLKMLSEWESAPEYLVLSGSLSPGMPDSFYRSVCTWANQKGIKVILDTSGTPLKEAVEEGVFLIKPNLRELSILAGKESIVGKEQEEMAMSLIESGKAKIVVLSLGARGAMMASREGIFYSTPPTVVKRSTVGAGDSMVAGIVWALSNNMQLTDVLNYGVACGTAATMNPGTELCLKTDIDNIFQWLQKQSAV